MPIKLQEARAIGPLRKSVAVCDPSFPSSGGKPIRSSPSWTRGWSSLSCPQQVVHLPG